ncbi:MAG: lipopolysaccharide kinase InaA family protein [bacterium]|nr:lipopolysaccharide kinase InaA family protein [bacterium]
MVPQGSTPGNETLPQSTTIQDNRDHVIAVCVPGVADALTALLQVDVAAWQSQGLRRIKERTVRSVFEGQLGDHAVHIKVFRANKLSDRARDALRGEPGEREARNLARARELGLPAAEPLAYGMASDEDQRRSFVVTRTIPGAEPFGFDRGAAVGTRVGTLLRRFHDLGCAAGDLHPGNLLIDPNDEAWLIDLTSFRHSGEQGNRGRATALAQFCQQFDAGALALAARPLLTGYRGDHDLAPNFAVLLADAARRWRSRALPAFGRRSTRNCRHTVVERGRRGEPRWAWFVVDTTAAERDIARTRIEAAAAAADSPADSGADKHGRRGGVWLHDDCVVKLRDPSHAQKLWRASYWLLFAGVPTPQPLAIRVLRPHGLVATRRIANVPLSEELSSGTIDAPLARKLAGDLGRSVGRLHAHGLRNRDLKFDNLVRDPVTDRLLMTDLDGVRRKAPEDTRGRGADLGRAFAAFETAGNPGGPAAVRAFVRGYLRAHRDLLRGPPMKRILRRATQRAEEWHRTHDA